MKNKTKPKTSSVNHRAAQDAPASSDRSSGGVTTRRNYGWLVVAAVAVVALGIVAYKSLHPTFEVAESVSQAHAALPAAQASTAQPAAATAPAAAAATALPAVSDPFPTDPAAQVNWAMRAGKPMMVLFHSSTCIPCKAMEKLVAQVRGDYEPRLVFVDVLTDNPKNLAFVRQVGIQAIPTTYFVDKTGSGTRYVGAMKETDLRAQLTALIEGS